MNSRSFLDTLNVSDDVLRRISLNLDDIEKGNDQVLITPMAKRIGPEEVLKGWDLIFNSYLARMNEVLLEIESSNRNKYGPRSIAVPWSERKPTVLDYFSKDESSLINISGVGPSRLRPLTVENASYFLKNNTNSGLPFYAKKGTVKEEVVSNFSELLKRRDPCLLFTRTQESKKTRTVWGYPMVDTLNEMRFYRPLLEYQRKLFWRSAINTPVDVDMAITQLIDHAMRNRLSLVSIDFSAYDASLKSNLQSSSFAYIKQLYQSSFSNDLDYIAERFNTIGIITPDGIIDGPHGVPSGSTFTNEIDSIAQFLIAENYSEDLSLFQIQGDDGAYACQNPESLFEHFTSYGLSVNKAKSDVSNNHVQYLQMLYHDDYRDKSGFIGGIYSTYRALLRLVYQERFDDFSEDDISGKDYFAIRTLAIIENCKHHPLFTEFVKYVASLDKYSLLPSDQGLSSYIKLRIKQDGKDVNFNSHQYGDSTGIKNFDSYKILASLN